MMDRLIGWPDALRAYARKVDGLPLVWGKTDCGALVTESVKIMYGKRPFKYRSRKAGLRFLAAHNVRDFFEQTLDATEIPQAFAQTGDVLVSADEREFVIVTGHGALHSSDEYGVRWLPALPDGFTCYRLGGLSG